MYNLTRSPLTAALYFLNAWNRLGYPREPLRGTEPIPYATIHFRGADSLRYRIRAEINVTMSEQEPNPTRFWCYRRSYPVWLRTYQEENYYIHHIEQIEAVS